MNLELKNGGDQALHVLKWNTPFDGLKNNIFSVVDENGAETTYTGIMMKRGPPRVDDFLYLAPNQTVSVVFDLSTVYLFNAPNTSYTISYSSLIHWVSGATPLPSMVHQPIADAPIGYPHIPLEILDKAPVLSLPVRVYVPKPLSFLPSPPRSRRTSSLGVSFTSCTSDRQSLINTAISIAKSMASPCVNYMGSSSCDSTFVTWFGRYAGSSRWSLVQGNFNRILTKLNSNNFIVNCAGPQCSSDTFAYVYPSDSSFTIYVCGAFWNAPNAVTYDSKPGTLIHEMSHFSVIGKTQDHTYGTAGAKDLASRNPDNACGNADNHEYFSESSPRC